MSQTKGIGTSFATIALVLESTGLHVTTISREVMRFNPSICTKSIDAREYEYITAIGTSEGDTVET
jgi:hypothetical protein